MPLSEEEWNKKYIAYADKGEWKGRIPEKRKETRDAIEKCKLKYGNRLHPFTKETHECECGWHPNGYRRLECTATESSAAASSSEIEDTDTPATEHAQQQQPTANEDTETSHAQQRQPPANKDTDDSARRTMIANGISPEMDVNGPNQRQLCNVCSKNKKTFSFNNRKHKQLNQRKKGVNVKWYCPLADTPEIYFEEMEKRERLKIANSERVAKKRKEERLKRK